MLNDIRKFYFINRGSSTPVGPVEAFLLPYRNVSPHSYVWTKGMKDWELAGNIIYSQVSKFNFDYCPIFLLTIS